MDPPHGASLRRTNSQVSGASTVRSQRILTSSGANREGREETDHEDDNIPTTLRQTLKRTFMATRLGDDEDENLDPGPSQQTHPSNRPHAANNQVMSYFMMDSKSS